MTPLRKTLIEITAGMADEPAQTMERLETYIKSLVITAKIETYQAIKAKIKTIPLGTMYEHIASEGRAYSLYCAGKSSYEVVDIVASEYPELDSDQIDKIVNDAKERFEESKNRHEL